MFGLFEMDLPDATIEKARPGKIWEVDALDSLYFYAASFSEHVRVRTFRMMMPNTRAHRRRVLSKSAEADG